MPNPESAANFSKALSQRLQELRYWSSHEAESLERLITNLKEENKLLRSAHGKHGMGSKVPSAAGSRVNSRPASTSGNSPRSEQNDDNLLYMSGMESNNFISEASPCASSHIIGPLTRPRNHQNGQDIVDSSKMPAEEAKKPKLSDTSENASAMPSDPQIFGESVSAKLRESIKHEANFTLKGSEASVEPGIKHEASSTHKGSNVSAGLRAIGHRSLPQPLHSDSIEAAAPTKHADSMAESNSQGPNNEYGFTSEMNHQVSMGEAYSLKPELSNHRADRRSQESGAFRNSNVRVSIPSPRSKEPQKEAQKGNVLSRMLTRGMTNRTLGSTASANTQGLRTSEAKQIPTQRTVSYRTSTCSEGEAMHKYSSHASATSARSRKSTRSTMSRINTQRMLYRLRKWLEDDEGTASCEIDFGGATGATREHDDYKFQLLVAHDKQQGINDIFRCTLSPTSPACIVWDIIFMVVITYDFITIPLKIGFDYGDSLFSQILAWCTRVFWTLSMPMSMVTGYLTSDGTVEGRFDRIVKHYFATWGVFDILMVGCDWLQVVVDGIDVVGSVAFVKGLRLLRVVRVLRLVKVAKFPEIIAQIKTRSHFEKAELVMGIAKYNIALLGMVHMIACFWFGLGGGNPSWTRYYDYASSDLGRQYSVSMHWAITQISGNCEVFPVSEAERWYANIVLWIGFFASTCFASEVTAALTRLSILSGHRGRQFATLRQYLDYNKISANLAVRVTSSAKYVVAQLSQNLPEHDVELLSLISKPLLEEIHYEVNIPILTQHPFFRRYHHESPIAMRKVCHSCITQLQLSMGDILFSEGERPQTPKMFFVNSGIMFYMKLGLESAQKVSVGEWACEMNLWVQWQHLGTMRAAAHSSLVALDVEQFGQIAREFQDPVFYPKLYASEVLDHLNQKVLDGDYSLPIEMMLEEDYVLVDDINYGDLNIGAIVLRIFPTLLLRTQGNASGSAQSLQGILNRISGTSAGSNESAEVKKPGQRVNGSPLGVFDICWETSMSYHGRASKDRELHEELTETEE